MSAKADKGSLPAGNARECPYRTGYGLGKQLYDDHTYQLFLPHVQRCRTGDRYRWGDEPV
eukprot:1454206-Rhodomonas_salina.1